MKNKFLVFTLFALMFTTLSSCAAIEGIFKAGMGVGAFGVIFVIVLIIFLIAKMFAKSTK